MNYLHAFLKASSALSKNRNTYLKGLTELTKPPSDEVSSVLSVAETILLPETEAEDDASILIPDRSVWRSVVATWDIPRRQEWADRAEQLQRAGKPWDLAEWQAFVELERQASITRDEELTPWPDARS